MSGSVESPAISGSIDKQALLAIGGLGLTAIITQTIMLREFLSIFSGNELVIGIVLASWMILTGTGSFLGRFVSRWPHRTAALLSLFFLLALFPLATVFFMDYFRNVFFPVGTMIGIMESLYCSFFLLIPFCICSGILFTLFAQAASEQSHSNWIAGVYSLEALGSTIGGLLFNLVIIYFLTTYQALILLAALNLSICLLLSLKYGVKMMSYLLILATGTILLIGYYANLDAVSKQRLFPNQEVLFFKDTPYGNLVVTEQGDQKNFYENSVLLFSTNDVTSNEEAVHYAMIQHPQPRRVLIISGGISGTLQEILKYGVDTVDYAEINPWLIEVGKRYTASLTSHQIHVHSEDGRKFIRETANHYDVALINVPDPGTAQINRYYTVEFLSQLKKKLAPGAVICLSLLPSVDYLGPEARQVSSVLFNTLKTSFRNVLIVPGSKNYFLASDQPLDINISARIKARGLNTVYVNSYYVDDESLRQRSEEITKSLLPQAPVNRDFTPIAYYRQLLYWLSAFQFSPWILGGIVVLILGIVLAKVNTISLGMFTGGFAATSMEVLILVSFQVIYGYVYQATGLIITIFMAGLAVGSLYGQRRSNRVAVRSFIVVQCATGIYSILFPFVVSMFKDSSVSEWVIHAIFLLLTFVIAALIGFEFCVAVRLQKGDIQSVASGLYGIDLVGSALGALLVSILLLPLFGIVKSSMIIGVLCLGSAAVTIADRKRWIRPSARELSHV
jgi:spermidine synthase